MGAYQMSPETLDTYAAILRDRYEMHEISADEYNAALEDVALIQRGRKH